MQTPFTYPNDYPASLKIGNPSKVTTATFGPKSPRDVAALVADAFGLACIFAALALFLVVTP